MEQDLDRYYEEKEEPVGSCLQALREIILAYHEDLTETWKYQAPFFCFRKKMFCYLWINKKTGDPYLGIVEGKRIDHPDLVQGKRSRMKILPIDPQQDIPIETIYTIFSEAILFYPK